jgi:hypothetical protein
MGYTSVIGLSVDNRQLTCQITIKPFVFRNIITSAFSLPLPSYLSVKKLYRKLEGRAFYCQAIGHLLPSVCSLQRRSNQCQRR